MIVRYVDSSGNDVILSDPNIPEDVETLVLDSFVEISKATGHTGRGFGGSAPASCAQRGVSRDSKTPYN